MPYAYGATITHEFLVNLLKIWVTFRSSMRRSSDPLASPPVYDIKPPLNLWLLEADAVEIDIIDSAWQDEHTLLLTSDTVGSRPATVTLEYAGPDSNLQTTWEKDWEPWGPILSTDLTATLWKTGMIIAWYGSIATIPSGWTLCDGNNGTPNLKERVIVGAGGTLPVGYAFGDVSHGHSLEALAVCADGYDWNVSDQVTDVMANYQPSHVLCYIMKL